MVHRNRQLTVYIRTSSRQQKHRSIKRSGVRFPDPLYLFRCQLVLFRKLFKHYVVNSFPGHKLCSNQRGTDYYGIVLSAATVLFPNHALARQHLYTIYGCLSCQAICVPVRERWAGAQTVSCIYSFDPAGQEHPIFGLSIRNSNGVRHQGRLVRL
jgi:hypothetical protein